MPPTACWAPTKPRKRASNCSRGTAARLVEAIQQKLLERTGKHVEVMVYGDGAFKDPVGKIWELADPVVSPAYTAGLGGARPTKSS